VITEQMIERSEIRVASGKVTVPVRMPWYRALPMSSVADMNIEIDGQQVDPSSITWTVEGKTYTQQQLPDSYQDWWFVQDTAYMTGELADAEKLVGKDAKVTVVLGLYIPYINAGAGILKIVEKDSKVLPVKEG
jgi:hypothetical protein